MGSVATVRIVGENGEPVIINKADFIEGEHELYVEGKQPEPKTIDKMKKDELIAYAEGKLISVDPTGNKAEILAAIKTAEEAPAE